MVVCKFFQQGHCRYGQSCRFEHVYGSKYTYHAPQHAPPATTTRVTDEQLVAQVASDVKAMLNGGQWLLSFYAPFKDSPVVPGIINMSFEEARLFIYEAKANNNVEQAVAYINNIWKDARENYERLLQPTQAIIKTLRALYNGETVAAPFAPAQTPGPAASVFRSAVQSNSPFVQNAAASIFAQKAQSVFGPSSPDNSAANIFNTSNPDPAKSIFAQASQNAFTSPTNSNVFGPQTPAVNSIFAKPPQSPFTTYSQLEHNAVEAKSIFASASQQIFGPTTQTTDPFNQNQNPFVQNTSPFQTAASNQIFEQTNDEDCVYSKMEDISPEDIEQFNNPQFKLGFIPELPPPKVLCS